jgi:hypothetical protein
VDGRRWATLWADWKNLPSDSKKIHGALAVEGVLVHFEYLTVMTGSAAWAASRAVLPG